jgi:hypothetical protein
VVVLPEQTVAIVGTFGGGLEGLVAVIERDIYQDEAAWADQSSELLHGCGVVRDMFQNV